MIGPAAALLAFSLTVNPMPADRSGLSLVDPPPPIQDSGPQKFTSIQPSGPLTKVISRQPVPLARRQAEESAHAEWARVRKLEPGREISVTIRGAGQNSLLFISADEAGITMLNLTGAPLPDSAARVLRETALQHPEYFDRATGGGTFLLDGLRMSAAGLYAGDQKIADLHQFIERRARTEVAQIRVRDKGRGFWGRIGPIGGYFLGALGGGYAGGVVCRAGGNRDCDTGPFLTGMMIGGVTGGIYGFRAARREVDDVIYQTPLGDFP
jgi:hypothetical protein